MRSSNPAHEPSPHPQPVIRFLDEIPHPDAGDLGGKAAVLARLSQAGYPIPDGFVIPSAAFTGDGLTPEGQRELDRALARLGRGGPQVRFAVRSSAAAEDSGHASFAGEFESILDVPEVEVAAAALRVWRSRDGERARAYAAAQGLAADHRMNVLVQRMVPAAFSGVLFTADPVTGSRAAMPGNAVRGLGDRLVSGDADPIAFRLLRPGGKLDTETEPAAFDDLATHTRELHRLADRIEADLGFPQDIEWAAAGGRIHILQSRPITTLNPIDRTTGAPNDSLLGDYLWTSTNFGEALPDVMTPLTWSMMALYLEVNRLGIETCWFPMGGNIGGRLYMNLSLPASLFTALGFGRARLQDMLAEAFGALPPGAEIPIVPNTRLQALRAFLPHALRRARLVAGMKKEIPGFIAGGAEMATAMRRAIEECETPAELLVLWAAQLEPFIRRTMLMLAAGTSDYKNLSRSLRPKLAALVGEADANALFSGRPGPDHLASLGPLIGLSRLARGEISADHYRQSWGHRGPSEFELANPSPAEEDGWIARQLESISGGDRSVEALLEEKTRGFEAAWERLRRDHPRAAGSWDRRLAAVDEASRVREAVRSEVVRLLRLLRPFALRAAELCQVGQDVFFLELSELAVVLEGDRSPLARVPERRAAHDRLSSLPPYPPFIRGRFDPTAWAADPDRAVQIFGADRVPEPAGPAQDGLMIRGFTGSPGVIEGTVRVLASIDDGPSFQPGEILVAHTTNVGWTPLFPRAAAIVTDVGAPLSHAAIVARELGVPAVVGTGTATTRLATGDRVRVDGARGQVTIL